MMNAIQDPLVLLPWPQGLMFDVFTVGHHFWQAGPAYKDSLNHSPTDHFQPTKIAYRAGRFNGFNPQVPPLKCWCVCQR